jgi:hypothetical protein
MANDQELKTEPYNGALVDSKPVQQGEDAGSSPRTSLDNMDSQNVEWKASKSTKLAFASICVLAMMAALDGTSIGVALPVSIIRVWNLEYRDLVADSAFKIIIGYRQGIERNRDREFLERHFVSPVINRYAASSTPIPPTHIDRDEYAQQFCSRLTCPSPTCLAAATCYCCP